MHLGVHTDNKTIQQPTKDKFYKNISIFVKLEKWNQFMNAFT